MNLILLLLFVVLLPTCLCLKKQKPEIDVVTISETCLEFYGNRNSASKARILSKFIGKHKNETEYQLIMEADLSNCSDYQSQFIPEQCAPEKSGTCFCTVKVTNESGTQIQSMVCLAFHPPGDSDFPRPVDIQLPLTYELAAKACKLYNPEYKLLAINEGTYGAVVNETINYYFNVKALNTDEEYECHFELELEVWSLEARLTQEKCEIVGYNEDGLIIGGKYPVDINDPDAQNYTIAALEKFETKSGKKIGGFLVKKVESEAGPFIVYYVRMDIVFCSCPKLRYCDKKEKCYFIIRQYIGKVVFIGSQNSLLPSPSNPKTTPSSPPGQNSLLKNFVRTNLNLFPVLSRVVKASYGADNDAVLNDDDIYYNTLLHHRIQKGSLLVIHRPTRQVRVLARSSKNGRCFSIPSTYQGLFKILRKSFKSLEEFLAWKDVEDADNYKDCMAPKVEEVRVKVITFDSEYGHLLQAGDLIRVKPIRPIRSQHDTSSDSIDQPTHVYANNVTRSSHYRSLGQVELEKIDPRNGNAEDISVPFDLKVELEEVVKFDSDRVMWTVGRLTPLAQKQRLWVKLVEPGTDHPTQDEDLPYDVPLELIQVIAEPSIWVSDQNPDAPVFHLPIRMDIYLRIVKPLMKESSPLLSKRRMEVSLLDRCVEHLPLPVFQEVLKCKYHVDVALEPQPIAGDQYRNGSKHPPTKIRPYSENIRHSSANQRPILKHGHGHPSSPTYIYKGPVIRKESVLTRIVRSASYNEPPLMVYPKHSVYRVARRTNSSTKRPPPVYLVSAKSGKKHPAITLTPATPKVKGLINQSYFDYEVPPRIYANEEDDDNDFIASVVVGKRNEGRDLEAWNSNPSVDQWRDSGEYSTPIREGVRDSMGGALDASEDWNVFKSNFDQLNFVTELPPVVEAWKKDGDDGDQNNNKNNKVTGDDVDHYNNIGAIDPSRIDSSDNQEIIESDAATDGSSKISARMIVNKNVDDDDDDGVMDDVGRSDGKMGTPDSRTNKVLLRKSPNNQNIPTAIIKPKEYNLTSNPDIELPSIGPYKEIVDPFNEKVTLSSNDIVTNSFHEASICPSIMAFPLDDAEACPSIESFEDPNIETVNSPYINTSNLSNKSYSTSHQTMTNNNKRTKSSIRHITIINTLAPDDDDDNSINSFYKERDDIMTRSGVSVKRSYSCNNYVHNPYDKNRDGSTINYNNIINNNRFDIDYNNNYNKSNSVNELDKKVFFEISLKEITSSQSVDKNYEESKHITAAEQRMSSSDMELAKLMEEMNLPHDGNLYEFDVEKFGELLSEFGFPESVVSECYNKEIDGKKFDHLSQKDLHDIGLRHPLIKFFKKKTFRPDIKDQ